MFTIRRSLTVRIALSNGAVAILTFRFAVLSSVGTPSLIMIILTRISAIELPPDVLELKQDDFYNFVAAQCGAIQANILRLQLISDASIFLECDDPTKIMQYNSGKLNDLKNDSCLMTTDGSFIVLPGITASFSNLKKRLSKKIEESIKEARRNRTLPNTSTPLSQPPTNQAKSTNELKSHMIKSIDQWVDKYRVDFDFQANSTFVEATDYHVQLVDNVSDQQSALIKCACGVMSSLSRHGNNGHYSVSRRNVHLFSSEGFSARDRKHSPRRRLCFLTHRREGRSEAHL